MPSTQDSKEFLIDKCRSKYSWAAGVARGTPSAIERHRRDLETAFAEINGLMAGLHYQDKLESETPAARADSTSPSTQLPYPASQEAHGTAYPISLPPQEYQFDSLDKDLSNLLEDSRQDPSSAPEPNPDMEHQPLGSQWAAIRCLREETVYHHKRFQRLARTMENPLIAKLLDIYPDAQSVRSKGAQLFKDILEGFRPRDLSLVFAFSSFSYATAQLLYKRGKIDKSYILAGLRDWRDSISDVREREAFNLLSRELWPEAKDHLHFIPVPIRPNGPVLAPVVAGVTPARSTQFSMPEFATFPLSEQSAHETIDMSCFQNAPFHSEPGGRILPDLSPNVVDLMKISHEDIDFAAINSLDNQTYSNHPASTSWLSLTGLCPPSLLPPTDAAANASGGGGEGEQRQPIDEVPKALAKLEETTMFLVILIFLEEIGELVYILSGRSLASRRHKLYKTEEKNQKLFYKSSKESFFEPRYRRAEPNCAASSALLSVAEKFTQGGHLRSIAEIKHYLVSVAAAVLPPGDSFERFLASVLHGIPVSARHEDLNPNGKRPRSMDGESSSLERTQPPSDAQRSRKFRCESCGLTYRNRSALRKHQIQVHVKPPPIRCPACDYGNARRDRDGHAATNFNVPTVKMAADITVFPDSDSSTPDIEKLDDVRETYNGLVLPTEEEKSTLRRVAGRMPATCYYLCAVEFAERASYYGCFQVYKNFIRAPLPPDGNGAGATAPGSQYTVGALGKGSVVATAMTEAFKFLAYALPILFGWLADTKYGRFKMICWGVAVCGVAHVIMIIVALPPVLKSGHAIGPFALSLYMLAIGASQFKPNISPTVMDQSPHKVAHVIEKDGEKVIVDPEESLNGVMLWFYLLIDIGACFGIPTTYLAKIVGYWAAYLIPTILYFMLPPLLCAGRLPPARRYQEHQPQGFWEHGKPSVRAAAGSTKAYGYDDQFVEDVRRTFQACGIFLFQPIFYINDGGLGAAANALTAGMRTNGLPNDLLDNLNSVSIVITVPIMNHVIYPFLRRRNIRWGAIARMTFGFGLCTVGSMGFSILQYHVYKTSPCGYGATTCAETLPEGADTLSAVSYAYYAIPIVLTAVSEIFVNVTSYGIAYSRSPKNMKGLVSSPSLFTTAIAAAIALATAPAIRDPFLI
ncbi:peptide transporter ptr2 [Madurella fahalii]|uniref:Peptide transporter ptr2 n=1 Tax=Madurella fahalii TaxID=1157608 RepID=A0ABQ0GH33_9PEZI